MVVASIGGAGSQLQSLHVFESRVVALKTPAFGLEELREALHLGDSDRRLHVGQSVVVADVLVNVADLVVFGLGGQVPCPLGVLGVVGDDHAAPAGGNDLVPVEGKATEVAHGACVAARKPALRVR